MKAQFTIGVFGIICNEQKEVLLCHRQDYDLWNLPGGALEMGETPEDAIRRELREELGVESEAVRLVGVYTKPEQADVVFCFECKLLNTNIALNEEADRFGWFSVNNLPKNLSPKTPPRIQDALLNLPNPVFKIQTGKSSIELIKEEKL